MGYHYENNQLTDIQGVLEVDAFLVTRGTYYTLFLRILA
jgi:hypothetical protein